MSAELAGILKLLGYGGGSGMVVIGSILAFHQLRIKSIKKTADRHDKILHGEDQDGGMIATVKVMNENITWIKTHLQKNGGK